MRHLASVQYMALSDDNISPISSFTSCATFLYIVVLCVWQVQCSPYLKFFLCTIYVPVCTMLDEALPPCQSLCLEVKNGCEGLMNRFGFQWPDSLDCTKFPTHGLCVGENRTTHGKATGKSPDGGARTPSGSPPERIPKRPRPICPPRLSVPAELGYRLDVEGEILHDCGLPCSADDDAGVEVFLNREERSIARYLIGVAAIACITSSLFTVLTFIIDPSRFRYPERSIVFLSACYLAVGTAYIVGFAVGPKIACVGPFKGGEKTQQSEISGMTVVTQGAKNALCSVIFAILYFFGMAASIWWVVLALTWFLAAGLKWGREAIESHAAYFHLAAWAMPAVQTFAALGTNSIGGDPVAGVCVAGIAGGPATMSKVFVLAPLCVYLTIGACFMLAGVVALFRIRAAMRHDGSQTGKLERLMVRIGVFGVLYAVPAAVVIACNAYEQSFWPRWTRRWYAPTTCFAGDVSCQSDDVEASVDDRPEFSVFVVKYIMTLLVGITSGFWIWSNKTLAAWRGLYARLCGGSSSPNTGPTLIVRTNTLAFKPPPPVIL